MPVNLRAGVAWPVARSNKWTAVAVLGSVAPLAAWISDAPAVGRARLAILVLALGAAQVLDDPMTDVVHASPTPFAAVRAWRLVSGLVPLAVAWTALLVALPLDGVRHALSLELLAVAAWVVALAAVAARVTGDGEGGPEAAAAVVALAAGSVLLPQRWTLVAADLADPQWTASHQRWFAMLVVAVAVLVVATFDPLRRFKGGSDRATTPP